MGLPNTAWILQGLGSQFAPRSFTPGRKTCPIFSAQNDRKSSPFGLHVSDGMSLVSVILCRTEFSQLLMMSATLPWEVCPLKTLPLALDMKFQAWPGRCGVQWNSCFLDPRHMTSSHTAQDGTGYIFSSHFYCQHYIGLKKLSQS